MLVGCLMSRRENRKPYSNTYSHKAKNNSHKSMFRTCLFCQLTTHFPRYSLKSKPMLLQRDLFWNGLITPVPTFSREHVHHPCTLRGRRLHSRRPFHHLSVAFQCARIYLKTGAGDQKTLQRPWGRGSVI